MSDVRSLLRARRADNESRVNHPYAAYNATGQLRCTVCVIAIKNATAWAGHVGSKSHRTNVAQLKTKEATALQNSATKRKEPEPEPDAMLEDATTDEPANKKQRRPTEFPVDFFSDPNRTIPIPTDDDDEEPMAAAPAAQATAKSAIDLEWEEFQRTVINAPVPDAMNEKILIEHDRRETWHRATVFAEPELASETPEGFPERPAEVEATETKPEEPRKFTVQEEAERKAQEERELIMDRLLAEEQAQEDADNRVAVLKARLEGIRKRKEATRLQKQKQHQ